MSIPAGHTEDIKQSDAFEETALEYGASEKENLDAQQLGKSFVKLYL